MERSKWVHLVNKIRDEIRNSYFTLWVEENGDMRVSRDYVNNSWTVVTDQMPEYHAIQEVTGPLEPDCWLNGYGYVGKGMTDSDLRYVGEVPKSSNKDQKVLGQTGIGHILGNSKLPAKIAPDPEEFEQCMKGGFYEKIVVCGNGSIDVWNNLNEGRDDQKRNFPAESIHKIVVEKHVGPLKPGDVIDFEKLGEYKFKIRRRPLD